jgi:ATP-binding cassette subfamily B protein
VSEETKAPRQGGPAGGPMGGGPPGMAMGGAKAKDFKKTMTQLLAYLAEYKTQFIVVICFAALSTTFDIVGPKILGKATTKLFEGLYAYYMGADLLTDFGYVWNIVVWLIGLYIVSAVFGYVQGWVISGVSMKVTYRFRKDISEKINRAPLSYFDTRTHGETLSRVTNDVDTLSQTLNQSLSQIITSVVSVAGTLIMMLSINFWMTLTALLTLPVSMGAVMAIVKRSQGYFKAQQKSIGQVNGHVEEALSAHVVVQAFNGEADSAARFEAYNNDLHDSALKSQFLSGLIMPVMLFISNLSYVATCILGAWLAAKRVVDVGDIQSFIQYVRKFTQPIQQLATISNTLQSTAAAAERVFEFLSEAEESPDPVPGASLANVTGAVEFKNVHFGYTPDKIILNNFSASIQPGQKIAIVGPTGAGKTTIVKLLMRFYEINGGRILLDGVDIADCTRAELRKTFGMVLQDAWLYNASIMDNLRYGSFDKPDEAVYAASAAAHCAEFIRALPGGYHMELNEEATNISQGQKQLLTIARVFLADPKILILDEATSSVDTRTEQLIQKAMEKLMRGRTSFVIAHRLSTIRDSDVILALKDGDVAEQGNHEELLKKGGFYANLYNSQFAKGGGPEE